MLTYASDIRHNCKSKCRYNFLGIKSKSLETRSDERVSGLDRICELHTTSDYQECGLDRMSEALTMLDEYKCRLDRMSWA
jgi:hypothetical protein